MHKCRCKAKRLREETRKKYKGKKVQKCRRKSYKVQEKEFAELK
jgi:hypothetical protein